MSLRMLILPVLAVLLAPGSVRADIDWVTVGDPGIRCNQRFRPCLGAVAQAYRISKTEVTNAQYVEFLNAVAATDTNALYSTEMGEDGSRTEGRRTRGNTAPRAIEGRSQLLEVAPGGIARSGSPGSFTYRAIDARAKKPVTFVSYWDALRFANWLHNGQPVGAQDETTTEDGAYTLTPAVLTSGLIERNADVARVFVPSLEEWYKAAYYNPKPPRGWFEYPAGTDEVPTCAPPGATPNTANCRGVVGDLTDVGSYTESASPNGTYDQGGNVFEWNEGVWWVPFDKSKPPHRNLRGGNYLRGQKALRGAGKDPHFTPAHESRGVGFRVASRVPTADGD